MPGIGEDDDKGRYKYRLTESALILMHADSKVHGANMGPIWGRQDPGGPHVSPMNFAIVAWIRTYISVKYILPTDFINIHVWVIPCYTKLNVIDYHCPKLI